LRVSSSSAHIADEFCADVSKQQRPAEQGLVQVAQRVTPERVEGQAVEGGQPRQVGGCGGADRAGNRC
jgi:hypothetical protein